MGINAEAGALHDLIVKFLRGARRLNPPHPNPVPSWDLSLVLTALQRAPFEPLHSAELKIQSMKTVLASIGRVGDLHAFSANASFLELGLDKCPRFPPQPSGIRW